MTSVTGSAMRSVPAYIFLATFLTFSVTTAVAQPIAQALTVVLPFEVNVDAQTEVPASSQASTPTSHHWASDANWIGASFAQRIREELLRSGVDVVPYVETRDAASELGLRYGTQLSDATAYGVARALGAKRMIIGSIVLQPNDGGVPRTSLTYEARVIDLDGIRKGPVFSGMGTLTDLIGLEVRASLQARAALKENITQLADPAFPAPEDVTAYVEKLPKRRLDAEELYARGLLAIDPDTRERYWRQALSVDRNFTPAAFALGQMLYRRQWYTRAAQWLELVGPDDPRYPAALFMRGVQALEVRDAELAQEIFQELLNVAPSPEVHNNLGVAESWLDLPFAAANLQELALQYPDDPDYRFNAAYLAWRTGQFAAAADGFARLLEMETWPVTQMLYERAIAEYGPSDSLGDDRLEQIEHIKRVVPSLRSHPQETIGE